MRKLYFLAIILTFFTTLHEPTQAQLLRQTIRGQITDEQSKIPLPAVSITLQPEHGPARSTASDAEGNFRFRDVPVGRVSLVFRYIGYEPRNLENIELSSGKELLLPVALREAVLQGQAVVITASKNKIQTRNEMASVSARTFSVEETQRYAGARNDVSRMAANFAGVRGANDGVNDIVIRGNAPGGLLWKLEGVDIPNPNHFGSVGATGGPVSMLNNNVLANSDFLTGAFPAEYGNAISGVFDLKMRPGNDEKHEFLGQVGMNGFELGAEGPFSRSRHSSYLLNYRYSTLSVLHAAGINFGTGSAVPNYQDISFKLSFPKTKLGQLSIFGLGGTSDIAMKSDSTTNLYNDSRSNIYNENKTGVAGLSVTKLLNSKTYYRITLAGSAESIYDHVDSISTENSGIVPSTNERFVNSKFYLSAFINHKFNSRHNLQLGLSTVRHDVSMLDSVYVPSLDRFQHFSDFHGATYLTQPYGEWQFRATSRLTFNSGLHFQYLSLNNSVSIEPRVGFKWQFNNEQSLSAAYGEHSQMLPMDIYFHQVELPERSYASPNKSLGFMRSRHYVFAYDWTFTQNLRLKAETYYQNITNVPVNLQPDSYSLLNAGTYSGNLPDSLCSKGSGKNYGIELTLEKFLDHGTYFLVTTSIYRSQYRGSDQVERNTAFSGNYVINALGGKEIQLKEKQSQKTYLRLDLKLTAAGGQRYTPLDLEQSRLQRQTVFLKSQAYSLQFKDYFRSDFRIAYRKNNPRCSQEFGIDIQNMTNNKNPLHVSFNPDNGSMKTVYQLGFFPMAQYRIEF